MNEWHLKPAEDLGLSTSQRLRSVRRESGSIPWLFHLLAWIGVRAMLQIFHRLQIVGKENLPPAGSFILVSNHCSHLDALVLACALPWRLRPDAFPIAAGDTFFKTNMTAALSALFVNALPMWRRGAVSHSLADLRARLASERCVLIIFPEGTRSRDGQLGRFKSGLGMIVAGTAIPVVPCRVTGAFAAMPPGSYFPRPKRITLRIGVPLRFEQSEDNRQGWDDIARKIESAVADMG